MKITRIKKIINIGTFAKFENGGSFEFDKITFFKANNTYGKTTLVNILQSLKENNNYIISNKTIPSIDENQRVEIVCKDDKQTNVNFESDKWQKNELKDELEIFGTDFIHKNIFTGLNISRENKEHFTDFVLGEKGVVLANKIEEEKKNLKGLKTELKNIFPTEINNLPKEQFEKFINFDISKFNKKEIEDKLIDFKKELREEQERLKEPQQILNLLDIEEYNNENINILVYFNNLNALFEKDFVSIQESALNKVKEHIDKNFKEEYKKHAENHIKNSIEYTKDLNNGNCVFCGQPLFNAVELIEAYNSIFSDEYKRFIEEIERDIKLNLDKIENFNFNESNKIKNILFNILKYQSYIKDKEFIEKLNLLQTHTNELENIENTLNQEKNDLLKKFKEESEIKKQKPYEKVDNINYTLDLTEYNDLLRNVILNIKDLKNKAFKFKESYKNTESVENKIKKLNETIVNYEKILKRINLDPKVEEYKKINADITKKEKEIIELEEKLRVEQNNYLNDYFDKVNSLFKKFGSRNFELEKVENRLGNKPVYFLKVMFHGQGISYNDLDKIFSESDRRALALAVFFAKIETYSSNELKNKIIILDDPITSFDNERSKLFISYLRDLYHKVSQIIIFTHYELFIAEYSKIVKKNIGYPKVIEFKRYNQNNVYTTIFNEFDLDYFLKSDYLKELEKIKKFIDYKIDNYELSNARKFLEDLYYPIFKDFISEEIYNKYYSELSSESHNFMNDNLEDKRNYLENMLKDLNLINNT